MMDSLLYNREGQASTSINKALVTRLETLTLKLNLVHIHPWETGKCRIQCFVTLFVFSALALSSTR